jgi:hypothetical protein
MFSLALGDPFSRSTLESSAKEPTMSPCASFSLLGADTYELRVEKSATSPCVILHSEVVSTRLG